MILVLVEAAKNTNNVTDKDNSFWKDIETENGSKEPFFFVIKYWNDPVRWQDFLPEERFPVELSPDP